MQDICRKTTGTELIDGAIFRECLLEGKLLPGTRRVFLGNEIVIVFPDGTARKITESEIPYEKHTVRMLLALDITQAYYKTQELMQMREKVERLGKRLQRVNQEIVAVTVEREILNAKVKIHDELGRNLLVIKRYLLIGGTEKEKEELMDSLRRSVLFLKNDVPSTSVRDEYELLTSMAESLGLTISVTGELPRDEHHKSVIATAIHECFTNTLRHAHGDVLHIEISEDEETITAVFTNNGISPEGEITEKGGLKSLRELAEQAGGSMTIQVQPAFTVTIKLPKEDAYGL
jgi:signal transduction histidine kinase